MRTLTHWSAKRSGACLTVSGRDEDGEVVTIPNVRKIERQYADPTAPITVGLMRYGDPIRLD